MIDPYPIIVLQNDRYYEKYDAKDTVLVTAYLKCNKIWVLNCT